MILKGAENWPDYKYQISCDMMGEDIWDVITGDIVEPAPLQVGADANAQRDHATKAKQFKDANNKAIALISRTLNPAMMKIARQQGHNAKAVWNRFEALFEAKTEHRAERLYNELSLAKLEPGEKVTEYITRIMDIWQQMQEATKALPGGGQVPEYILTC